MAVDQYQQSCFDQGLATYRLVEFPRRPEKYSAQRRWAHAEAKVKPIGRKALHYKSAPERIQGEERRQVQHNPKRAVQTQACA